MTAKQRPSAWWRYVRFWGSNVRDDVNDELRFHVDMRVAEYVARGMSENEARRRAADRFGDVDRTRDSCVDIQEKHARAEGRAELGSVLQRDVAFGLRVMRRQTLPSLVAALCIALGIGATTAMFTIGNALLLRPLPYPRGDRLVQIGSGRGALRRVGMTVTSLPDLVDWRTRQRSFADVAGVWQITLTVSLEEPFRANGAAVTANLFQTLGVRAEAGRVFRDGEDAPSAEPVAVVTRRFAERRFGGTDSILGRRVRIAGARRTIVGVIPDRWAYPATVDIWIPLGRDPLREGRGNRYLSVLARLKPNVTAEAADREMTAIGAELRRENPEDDADIAPFVTPLREVFVGPARSGLLALGLGTTAHSHRRLRERRGAAAGPRLGARAGDRGAHGDRRGEVANLQSAPDGKCLARACRWCGRRGDRLRRANAGRESRRAERSAVDDVRHRSARAGVCGGHVIDRGGRLRYRAGHATHTASIQRARCTACAACSDSIADDCSARSSRSRSRFPLCSSSARSSPSRA